MEICILYGWIPAPKLKESTTTVYLTLITAVSTLTIQLILQLYDASAANESFTLLGLENMTARIGWLPFMGEIRKTSVALHLDYGNIRGSYGFLTRWMGLYR